MRNFHHYYDFKVNGVNLGYFEIKIENDEIYQNVKFQDGNEVYENPFYLRLDSEKIKAFKKADGDWIDLQKYKENHFPSSAYPLLLSRVNPRFEYFQINEASEAVEGLTVLEKNGEIINEYRDKKLLRSFKMKNNLPVEINWGGAISSIKNSFGEAIAGSPIAAK